MGRYFTLDELIHEIETQNRKACYKLYNDNKEMFDTAKGSSHNHQAWVGGYIGHIKEIMNIALQVYNRLEDVRSFPFEISDALLVLFLHDLEKPWKYSGKANEVLEAGGDELFRKAKIEEYGFILTDEHWNALKYVHGEGNDHRKDMRVSNPLAAFVHCCDTMSARIWFDFPKEEKW